MSLSARITRTAQAAKSAASILANVSAKDKRIALKAMAKALLESQSEILLANAKDLKVAAQAGYGKALVDRLTLDPKRLKAMADGILATAKLHDPVGDVLQSIKRPNGLSIRKVRVPLGVVGIIFESRPNVVSDCAALCLMSGNAAILKGGREAAMTNHAVYDALIKGLSKTKIPKDALQLIDSTNREAVVELLKLDSLVDVIVPRGGEELIRFVVGNTRIPVVKHFKGVCHVFVSRFADLDMATSIAINAKTQKPGVCNAMETLLVDMPIAKKFLPGLITRLVSLGCEIRGDAQTQSLGLGKVKRAVLQDWSTEYLDLILSIRVVNGVQEAVEHINTFGSRHSDAIVTKNIKEAKQFLQTVDSACVYHNASTRFTDGFEFGFGAEVGISTDKLHVRGPMALEGLCSYKYEIKGNGQIRQ